MEQAFDDGDWWWISDVGSTTLADFPENVRGAHVLYNDGSVQFKTVPQLFAVTFGNQTYYMDMPPEMR